MLPNQQTPDVRGYEQLYLRFLGMKRAFKNLNHTDHEPKPADFGLSDRDAAFIRVRVERDFSRKK